MDKMMIYLTAIGLGALHAFEPGHGKSIIAAYMVGTRGKVWDGVFLGFVATIAHTFSILILGLAAALLALTFPEETIHAWFGIISALLILAVGLWMLSTRLAGRSGHFHLHLFGGHHHHHGPGDGHKHLNRHGHQHGHECGHDLEHQHEHQTVHEHGHEHGQGHGQQAGPRDRRSLLLLGISGGLAPCPAAMTALLVGIGSGNALGGLITALFFSIGLGLVMVTIGVTLACAGQFTENICPDPKFSRALGLVSALLITGLGLYILLHALATLSAR